MAEGADIPDVVMTTDAKVVAVKKLGGIVLLTSESIEDAQFDTEGEVRGSCRARSATTSTPDC